MLMDSRYDVIISGAGPSGSLLGYLLASKGISTLILEKQEFPRHKRHNPPFTYFRKQHNEDTWL
jgi:flavin-dependent dehydrogenase